MALVLLTFTLPRLSVSSEIAIRVTDRFTGAVIPGARVVIGESVVTSSPDGVVTIELRTDSSPAMIEAPGYQAITTTLSRGASRDWQVALRPTVLRGRLADAETSAGIAGAEVVVLAPDGTEQKTATDSDGRFAFDTVPEDATVRFSSPDHGIAEELIGQRTEINLTLRPSVVSGRITDTAGAPIDGARIAASNGSAESVSGPDGTFRLMGGSDVTEVVISAPGHAIKTLKIDASRNVTAALETEMIKAVYANLGVLSDPERWNRLIEIANTTEVNAIVIDVKQDTIYYDTQVPFYRDIDGMITPIFDPAELLAELDAHGIYSIARMVVFKDPVVAAGRPDLAVRDETTGELWRDMNGTPWVNAFNQELWQANADLGAELAHLGFDEIQYDYIRFPSDGDLRTADFGNDYSEESRRAAIRGAVALGAEKVRAAGAVFAIDLFPIIALLGDDQGIGQTLQDLTPLADYVCLMIYPSHYEVGNIPVDGHPNDFPAETVTYTLERSQEWAPDTMKKMRPWLQDFTYPLEGYSAYGPEQVRAQIDAAEAQGVSGWLLWNAAGEFQDAALAPE
ncbi:MAG TPA: putative glycoside hydrolase [Thermomicrobiales bacterium]|nr:putative glycoside hydrolase [Thermomicrobiales bacterium]